MENYYNLYFIAEFMAEEIKKYEMGKRWLAKMMGAEVETFTDSDVEVQRLSKMICIWRDTVG